MGGESAEANVNKATTAAAEPAPEPSVVTDPEDDGQITNPFVLFPIIILVLYAYLVFVHFSVGGPLWEAFAWSAGEAPLFLIPLWAILKMRDDIIRYAKERSDDGTGGDLSANLLGHEIV
ncbi:unnamed protein product [Urochloa decumbens]|uniref:Uncharacterized protein n=1 Tax=Urochloa decumbens TaxID=240449 RepID=A0ABC9D6G4_9POAL